MPSINSIPVTSPDISVLGYSVLYDISGPTPTITITNQSTVANPSNLIWWYTIQMPDGTYLHQGSVGSPDVSHVAWTTIIVPDLWPLPFGTPPYGQIEFSCSIPYILTMYVQDSDPQTFSLGTPTTICRPNGSEVNTPGNFGAANVSIETLFQSAQLRGIDTTNYSYQNLLGTSQNNKWTLVYPFDNNNIRPADAVAVNAATVLFPIGFTGDGYQIAFQSYSLYDLGNGSAIKIQYKFVKVFSVWLNVNLRALRCEMDRVFRQTQVSCGTVMNPNALNILSQMNYLYLRVFEGIIWPLQCVDIPGTIAEIQRIGCFSCDCFCNDGINAAVIPVTSTGGTVQVPIYAFGTTTAPTQCPNSYFPANVLNPEGTSFIGLAYQVEDLVAILNSTPAWQAYGIFFPQGNCLIGCYPVQLATAIPPIIVSLTSNRDIVGTTQNYITLPVSNCGSGAVTLESFPLTGSTIDFGGGPISIATPLNNINDYITELNAQAVSNAFPNITFGRSSVLYPLAIVVHNNNTGTSIPTISLGTCPLAPSTPNLQQVTTGTNNEITTNGIITGALLARNTKVDQDGIHVANNAGTRYVAEFVNLPGDDTGGIILREAASQTRATYIYSSYLPGSPITVHFPASSGILALLTDIPTPLNLQTTTDNGNITTNILVVGALGSYLAAIDSQIVQVLDSSGSTDVVSIRNGVFGLGTDTGVLALREAGSLSYEHLISTLNLTGNRSTVFQNKSGTVALLSDATLQAVTTGTGNNITTNPIVVANVSGQNATIGNASIIVSNSDGSQIVAELTNNSDFGELLLYDSGGYFARVQLITTLTANRNISIPDRSGNFLVGNKGYATLLNGNITVTDALCLGGSAVVTVSYSTVSGTIGTGFLVTKSIGSFNIKSIVTTGLTQTADQSIVQYQIVY